MNNEAVEVCQGDTGCEDLSAERIFLQELSWLYPALQRLGHELRRLHEDSHVQLYGQYQRHFAVLIPAGILLAGDISKGRIST